MRVTGRSTFRATLRCRLLSKRIRACTVMVSGRQISNLFRIGNKAVINPHRADTFDWDKVRSTAALFASVERQSLVSPDVLIRCPFARLYRDLIHILMRP